jgi:hypothetical protein
MAKRRNAKKEKAARNKVNARKFRKQPSRYSFKARRADKDNQQQEQTEESISMS